MIKNRNLKALPKFSPVEALNLNLMFSKISENGRMDRSQFREMLYSTFDMNDNHLMDRMFRTLDADADGYLSFNEWINGVRIFLKGNLTELASFCFRVYDIDCDGYLTRDDMFSLLKTSLKPLTAQAKGSDTENSTPTNMNAETTESEAKDIRKSSGPVDPSDLSTIQGGAIAQVNEDDPDEGARYLSDAACKLLDADSDGRVSLQDFLTSTQNDSLLLEILGPCLPPTGRSAAVLAALNTGATA